VKAFKVQITSSLTANVDFSYLPRNWQVLVRYSPSSLENCHPRASPTGALQRRRTDCSRSGPSSYVSASARASTVFQRADALSSAAGRRSWDGQGLQSDGVTSVMDGIAEEVWLVLAGGVQDLFTDLETSSPIKCQHLTVALSGGPW
jgi:hypothetical protein